MDGVPTDQFFSIQFRYAIVTFLFAVLAYTLALVYQQFDATGALGSPKASGHSIYSLPFHLCAIVLALAGLWLLLFISAAACTTPGLRLHYLFFWIERDFVSASWTGMSWASTIAFFVVFPFAYLYEEAEGIASQSSVMARIIETAIVQILVSILFHGSLGLFQFLLTGQRLGLSFFTSGYAFQLPGLLLFLIHFREGFQHMIVGSIDLLESWNHQGNPERVAVYELALESVLQQIEIISQEPHPKYSFDSSEVTLESLQLELLQLQNGHSMAVRRLSRWQTLARNAIASFLLFLSVFLPLGIAVRSLLKCEELLSDVLWRFFGLQVRLNLVCCMVNSISFDPLISLSFDISLVLYLLAAVASAGFDSPSFKWVAGLYGHTRSPIQYLLARNTFILLLCSNLPVVTSLLGITQIDIEKVFPDPKRYPSLVYCTVFLMVEIVSALELFGIPISKPMASFAKMLWYCCCHRRCGRHRRKPRKLK